MFAKWNFFNHLKVKTKYEALSMESLAKAKYYKKKP